MSREKHRIFRMRSASSYFGIRVVPCFKKLQRFHTFQKSMVIRDPFGIDFQWRKNWTNGKAGAQQTTNPPSMCPAGQKPNEESVQRPLAVRDRGVHYGVASPSSCTGSGWSRGWANWGSRCTPSRSRPDADSKCQYVSPKYYISSVHHRNLGRLILNLAVPKPKRAADELRF